MKKGTRQRSFQKRPGKALTTGKQVNTHHEPINMGYASRRAASPITLFFICALLITAISIPYLQVINHGFINYDDGKYILNNPQVINGLSMNSFIWAFTSSYASNWHPLTWLSHIIDFQIFGLDPGMFHLVNVLLHSANTLLLFLILNKMTGELWKSALVAALFAIHPVHVESVAWISERKDVLSTFFWMLTMMGYLWYVQQRNIQRYLAVLVCYILGLLSKPMLVTLPFVLLLIDFWPLNGGELVQTDGKLTNKTIPVRPIIPWSRLSPLIREKIPLLILAMMSCSVTFYVQQSGGAMSPLDKLHLGTRLLNALSSYLIYLWKMLVPLKLAVYYPYPSWDYYFLFSAIGSLSMILLITCLVLFVIKTRPYLAVGWFWYLGTLVPVIGIVQVGSQSMADRYTYIPLIGIFIMIIWGIGGLIDHRHSKQLLFRVISVIMLFSLIWATWVQVGYWKDNETLFRHAIEVTKNNDLAYNSLAKELFNQKKYAQALSLLQDCLKIKRNKFETYNNLGNVLAAMGNLDGSLSSYKESLRLNPHQGTVYFNVGITFYEKRDFKKASEYFQEAVQEDPGLADQIKTLENARNEQK
jgi:protein O-mannosyl-transferase